MQKQWLLLRQAIQGDQAASQDIHEPFFCRVLEICADPKAGLADNLAAYYDALQCANAHGLNFPKLPGRQIVAQPEQLQVAGLYQDPVRGEISLTEVAAQSLNDQYAAVYRREQRRFLKTAPIDNALSARLKDPTYRTYNGEGQQAAVRATLTSPDDSTLFINLPTGCGKTLVLNALMLSTPAERLTLVIVPTVGLAIEQGERVREVLQRAGKDHGGAYAWYYKRDAQQRKQERSEIKQRLLAGQQRVLFCSPESAKGALLPILFKLAKTGQLASVVIDEAHLVDQWGAEFRPEFQLLSPLIHSLQSESPRGLRKILMSATFHEATMQTLKELFTPPKQTPIEVNGSFLRPEPSYFVQRYRSPVAHHEAILTTVRSLPRPLILYATEVADASLWYSELRGLGFNRVGLFHGDTDESHREYLIRQWKSGELDIMVATSAFGVGMDKQDVRSVLHAALPENIDRFYQESGRGGRDGCASLSWLIYHPGQIDVARKISQDKLITNELGLKRWSAMHALRQTGEDGRSYVSLDAKHEDIKFHSKANRAWNWRTLLLMQRGGFIRLHFNPPKLPEAALDNVHDDQFVQQYFEKYFRRVGINMQFGDHLKLSAWQQRIGKQRDLEKQARDAGFSQLVNWLENLDIPLCGLLGTFYTLDGFSPEIACGGCPGCRSKEDQPFLPYTPTLGKLGIITGLTQQAGLGRELQVYYSARQDSFEFLLHQLRHRISELITSGRVKAIRARPEVLTALVELLPEHNAFWCALEPEADNELWDELAIVLPTETALPDLGVGSNAKIIIAPDHIKDPDNPGRTWCENAPRAMSKDQFLRNVSYVDYQ
ncbi:protein DpdF [Corallincola platygyrae]|uniref:DNA 3'-5' helicase n=1 Tax=Corallincola platygyrae TaxID=1193278 RepID=A0ABW4XJV0_9GAMM